MQIHKVDTRASIIQCQAYAQKYILCIWFLICLWASQEEEILGLAMTVLLMPSENKSPTQKVGTYSTENKYGGREETDNIAIRTKQIYIVNYTLDIY